MRPRLRTLLLPALAVAALVSRGAVRDFVVADVRGGLPRVRELPPATRAAWIVGLAAVGVLVVTLLAGAWLRDVAPLVESWAGGPARGEAVPLPLLPLTFLALALAWGLLLAAALYLPRSVAALILVAYLGATAVWLGADGPVLGAAQWLRGALVAVAPAVVVARRLAGRRRPLEIPLVLGVVLAVYAATQFAAADLHLRGDIPRPLLSASITLDTVRWLVVPVLAAVGVAIAAFVARVTTWVVSAADAVGGARFVVGAAVALATVRLAGVVGDLRGDADLAADRLALEVVVAAALVAALVGLWRLAEGVAARPLTSRELQDSLDRGPVPWLSFALLGPGTAFALVALLTLGVTATVDRGVAVDVADGVRDVAGVLFIDHLVWWQLAAAVGVLAVAGWALARRRARLALAFGAVGLFSLWARAAQSFGLVGAEADPYRLVDAALVLSGIGLALRWRRHGGLTGARRDALLLAAVVLALVPLGGALNNPYGFVVAFSGVGMAVFGLAWSLLTSGAFVNGDTARLPRPGRLLGYLGYALLTVTALTWAVVAQDSGTVEILTDGAAEAGFAWLGRPVLYAWLTVVLLGRMGAPERVPTSVEQRR